MPFFEDCRREVAATVKNFGFCVDRKQPLRTCLADDLRISLRMSEAHRDNLRPMCRLGFFACLVSVAVFAAGCGVDQTVVARVDRVEIEVGRFQNYLESVTGSQWADVDSRAASRLFDQFLEQEAVALTLQGQVGGASVEGFERSALLRRFLDEICGPPPTVPPEELAVAVEIRMGEVVPEQVYIRQLLLTDLGEAQAARVRFEQGEDFIELSRELSLAPNAEGGGVIGWVIRGTQPEDIEAEIYSLEAGRVSQPVEGPAGYHLFQVLEVRAPGQVPAAVASSEVHQELVIARSREHLSRCVDQAVSQAGVEIFKKNLWFDYRGQFAED